MNGIQLALRGKYAVGVHQFAIIDEDMYDELNQYAWKAKPNEKGNNVYAVREVKCADGVTRTVRMHRVVIGYGGALDIDHINHNALDNRRANLRIVTRKENALNMRLKDVSGRCSQCGVEWVKTVRASSNRSKYCSKACSSLAGSLVHSPIANAKRKAERAVTMRRNCARCNESYIAAKTTQKFCSEGCRKAAKRHRQKEQGLLPPSVSKGTVQAIPARVIRTPRFR